MLFSDRLTVNLLSKSDQTLGKLNVTSTGNLLVDARSAIPTSSLPFLKKRLMSRVFDGVEVDFFCSGRRERGVFGARVIGSRRVSGSLSGWEGRSRPAR
jgi:hypothetical protein